LNIIPVIDLLDGHVVHARRGERQHYQPIKSSLCAGSDPLTIVQALLELYPFDQLYIADLNGIQKRGNHLDVITAIQRRHPQLKLWLDSGFSRADDLANWQALDLHWVIGSESLSDPANYHALEKTCGKRCILSLDFASDGYRGPITLLETPALWPQNIIVMTLAQVGSNAGPDHEKLKNTIAQANGKYVYAAGGIRHQADLQELKTMGVHGALVASALHGGQLTMADISEIK
jgi:phosphoribosylformimino-5-aminoimidazole carboxamide ribotide isomerase